MNNGFSLSRPKEKILPVFVKSKGGECFNIDADFRNILKIIRLYSDNTVISGHKAALTLKWFYKDKYPELSEALSLLQDFISYPENDKETKNNVEQQFCYEFDAQEIYVSFLTEYKINPIDIDFLHWFLFKIMLLNLPPESPFKQKIKLRFLDLKDYKGETLSKLTKAKRSVQLPKRFTPEEERRLAYINEVMR